MAFFNNPMGGLIGNVVGGVISGAINAAQNANKKPSGSGSSGSSSSGSSYKPSGSSSGTSSGSSYKPSGSSSGTSSRPSGGSVLESVNGKAPEGAQIGDTIVTNGGSYLITGKNPDGSWISQKVSDVHTNRYPATSGTSGGSAGTSSGNSSGSSSAVPQFPAGGGSASNVSVYDQYQQAIRDQMNANSKAWYQATTQEEKDRLHQENVKLAAMLGGNISYDGHTGQWSGMSDAPELELPELTLPNWNLSGQQGGTTSSGSNYTPTDNSEYLEEMAKAYLEKQKEALKQAYEQNLSNLQAEQDKLGANYQAARNQEAADNALARKRWNETAAAYGLNSGTQGQAQLSYANQLQSDLSTLQAAESAANAEVERQRTDLGKQYQSALEEAVADNNYELYEKLYQEAVRVDQALQQQSQFNAQMALQQYQAMLDKYYNDRQWQFTQQQWQYQQQQDKYKQDLAAAELAAQSGDYSSYGKLFGWDDTKIQQMNNAWKAANTPRTTYERSASASGGGTDTESSDDLVGEFQSAKIRLYEDALKSEDPELYIKNQYPKYGLKSPDDLVSGFDQWYETGGMNDDYFRAFAQSVSARMASGAVEQALNDVNRWWDSMSGNQKQQINTLLSRYGYSAE